MSLRVEPVLLPVMVRVAFCIGAPVVALHCRMLPEMLMVGGAAWQPRSWKIWSGLAASIAQVAPLAPQVRQPAAKPPPGFCQAAGELDTFVLSVQPDRKSTRLNSSHEW